MKINKYDVVVAKTSAAIQRLSTILERYIYEGLPKSRIVKELNGSIINLIEINTALEILEEKNETK